LFTTRQLQLRGAETDGDWVHVVRSVGGTPDRLMRIRQVHGRTIRRISAEDVRNGAAASTPDADALISNVPDVILAVQVADCVPMLLCDTRTGVAAAVHAGWRGTCAGIAGATVAAMARDFGCAAADVRVAIGPSIGACCYEVGDELIDAFRRHGAREENLRRWFTRTRHGSLRLDLWAANRDHLIDAGVPSGHIATARLCTQTHVDLFHSYRAAGPAAGRMAAAVKVPRI
jgi:YfiH family protein